VEAVLEQLRASLPDLIPRSRKNLSSLLNSVRGLYMREPSESKRGRPARYRREQLLRVDTQLRDLLARETSISVRSFVGQYLPILDFPQDVREALERGEVNLGSEGDWAGRSYGRGLDQLKHGLLDEYLIEQFRNPSLMMALA
jgi:hypothetical protein